MLYSEVCEATRYAIGLNQQRSTIGIGRLGTPQRSGRRLGPVPG